jgi:hypothetical protein
MPEVLGYIISAIAGIVIIFLLFKLINKRVEKSVNK